MREYNVVASDGNKDNAMALFDSVEDSLGTSARVFIVRIDDLSVSSYLDSEYIDFIEPSIDEGVTDDGWLLEV